MEIQRRKEILDSLNNKLKRKKYFALLLALFTFGVNIFAWFVFTTSVSLQVKGNVSAWDVRFNDGNSEIIKNALVNVTNMKPGMEDFNKTFVINNMSDVSANFTFKITSIELMGNTVDVTDIDDSLSFFNQHFPFNLTFNTTKDKLGNNESLEFNVEIKWPYDNDVMLYYPQDSFYTYNSTFAYYKKSDSDDYSRVYNIESASNFNSAKNSLYLDKDDADSFFGMKCNEYENNYGRACLNINIQMKVEQVNE